MADLSPRRAAALIIAGVAHVERNLPVLFTSATIERFENATTELLGNDPLSFETTTVLRRIAEALRASSAGKPGAADLADLLDTVS